MWGGGGLYTVSLVGLGLVGGREGRVRALTAGKIIGSNGGGSFTGFLLSGLG